MVPLPCLPSLFLLHPYIDWYWDNVSALEGSESLADVVWLVLDPFFFCMKPCMHAWIPLLQFALKGWVKGESKWYHDMLTCFPVGNCYFFAGNPPGHAKKALKQRFLKLLPCCRQPKSIPSISESKWYFVPVCLSSLCCDIIVISSWGQGEEIHLL